MGAYLTLEIQGITDSKFHRQFADEDDCFPDQVYVSDKDGSKRSTSKSIFNMDVPLQQDSAFDQYLKEEQQKKVMSGSAKYNTMQVCRRTSVCITLYMTYTFTDKGYHWKVLSL